MRVALSGDLKTQRNGDSRSLRNQRSQATSRHGNALAQLAPPSREELRDTSTGIGNQALLRRLSYNSAVQTVEFRDTPPGIGNQALLRRLRCNSPVQTVPLLQRKCSCEGSGAECSTCKSDHETPALQRKAAKPSGGVAAPPVVHSVLRSSGQPLEPATRAQFEPRFGHDFGNVRVYNDSLAAESARSVKAHAYTVGSRIVFGEGQYSPSSPAGNRLLAHELSHVVQQSGSTAIPSRLVVGPEDDQAEREARKSEKHGDAAGQPAGSSKKSNQLVQRDTDPKATPSVTVAPVLSKITGTNILYIGVNNYGPEVAKLNAYTGTHKAKSTVVTVSEEESKTAAGGGTYDLTGTTGIEAYVDTLALDKAQKATLVTLIQSQAASDRDELVHVIAVYAMTQADGKDRMTRVVFSGHSYGPLIFNHEGKGSIYFQSLVTLRSLFPDAAAQTRHVLVLACFAGAEENVKKFFTQAFPNLQTFWGYTDACPTGPGAAAKLQAWLGTTEKNPTSLDRPPSGEGNWVLGLYQSGDADVDGPAMIKSLQDGEAQFNDYLSGKKVDPNPHAGFLFEYYGKARRAALASSVITGPDHDYAQKLADESFRLRFWPGMTSHFWKTYGAKITKGYGTGAVPAYATLSRSAALAAIASFDKTTTASAADQAAARALLISLRDLNPAVLDGTWIEP